MAAIAFLLCGRARHGSPPIPARKNEQFMVSSRQIWARIEGMTGSERITLEIKTAADLEAGIRIDFPLTVLIQWVPSPAEEYP
jgi:hypothetical protein